MLKKKFFGKTSTFVPPPFDGTYAIFKVGNSVTTTNKYTFSGNVVATATPLLGTQDALEAFSNTVKAVFLHSTTTAVYTFAGETVASGPAPGVSLGSGSGTTSTNTDGFVFVNTANPVRRFNYAGNTFSNGSSLTATPNNAAAAGNTTYAICSLGGASGGSNLTNKYVYSNDGVSSATNLQANISTGCATGNATKGVFSMSTNVASASTNTYTYSDETTAFGGGFTANTMQLGCAGNGAVGVFVISTLSSARGTNVYSYDSDTSAVGTVLTSSQVAQSSAAASNGISGVTA